MSPSMLFILSGKARGNFWRHGSVQGLENGTISSSLFLEWSDANLDKMKREQCVVIAIFVVVMRSYEHWLQPRIHLHLFCKSWRNKVDTIVEADDLSDIFWASKTLFQICSWYCIQYTLQVVISFIGIILFVGLMLGVSLWIYKE